MRKPAPKPSRIAERLLGVAGVICAVASAEFARIMLSDPKRVPTFSGIEYLGIFAKPSSAPGMQKPDGTKGTMVAGETNEIGMPIVASAPGAPEVDLTPVGSLPSDKSAARPAAEKPISGYWVRGVFQGKILIQGPDGFVLVQKGSNVPRLGQVLAIDHRGSGPRVLTEQGVIGGRNP